MKTKHILLATLLLSQTSPLWGMDDEPNAVYRAAAFHPNAQAIGQADPVRGPAAVAVLRDKITLMENAVDQTLTDIRTQAPGFHDKKVFVIGRTGHGKSTFLHAVAGVPLEATENDNGIDFNLDAIPGRTLPGLRIGHDATVGTVTPGSIIDHARQAVFIDYLGFGDPRGPADETAIAVGIKRLFEQGRRGKILLVIEQPALTTRRDNLVPQLLNEVAASFPDDNFLRNSIRLVVTKATERYRPVADLGRWRNHVQMTDRAKILIDSFLQPNQVFKFLAPVNEGRYDLFNNDEFSRVLGQDGYTLNPRVTPVLSDASKLLINDTVDDLRETGRRYLEEEASDSLQTICDGKINDNTIPNRKIKELRTDLRTLRQDVLNLQTLDHFKDQLHQIIGDNDVSGHRPAGQAHPIGGLVENVEFLQELHPTVNTPEDTWRAAFAPITRSIESLAADPQINAAHGILSIKGGLLGMRDLKKWKKSHPAVNVTLVKMFTSNTLFADTDFQQENCSIAIYSPMLNAMQPTVIDISGRNGGHGSNGATGMAGINGGHGTPGAHFLAKIREESGLANFTILARGGNGGNGGNGGTGRIGANGDLNYGVHSQINHGLLEYGWGCRNGGGYTAEGHWIRSNDLRHQLDLRYTQVLYQASGEAGSNGGNGGQSGQGAPCGSARIVGAGAWAPSAVSIVVGTPGTHGRGGAAGFNGHSCIGEYQINRRLAYQALVGKNGFLGLGTGIYADRFIELPDRTVTARQHVGGGATNAGITPTTPHGSIPAAIPAIDEIALDAEYAAFHAAELANPDAQRFVKDLP